MAQYDVTAADIGRAGSAGFDGQAGGGARAAGIAGRDIPCTMGRAAAVPVMRGTTRHGLPRLRLDQRRAAP